MKKILSTIITILALTNTSFANEKVIFGYGMYVGGINVADAKAELNIKENNDYSFKSFIFSQGIARFLTDFNFVTTSKGKLTKTGVKFNSQISSSYSNFGDTYTVLERKNGKTNITKYPDPVPMSVSNLPGNPLAKANDPISSILTLMQQIKHKKKCDINMIVITNHFLYKAVSKSTKSEVLESDSYNIANGKSIACLVEFHRLDDQKNLDAYGELGDEKADNKSTYPTFHFIKLKGIPYYIPVSIEATEQRFGSFRLNLQYVKYKNKVYKAGEWNESDSFPDVNLKKLKTIPKILLEQSKLTNKP